MNLKNIFARFLAKEGTAVAAWKKHFSEAQEKFNSADRFVVETHNRLKTEMEAAQARHAQSGADEDWTAFQSASTKFRENDAAFQRWAAHSSHGGKERLEAALDLNLCRRAISEGKREIEARHKTALGSLTDAAEVAGLDVSATVAALNKNHASRIDDIHRAEVSIENIAITDRGLSPRGLVTANSYLETALRP